VIQPAPCDRASPRVPSPLRIFLRSGDDPPLPRSRRDVRRAPQACYRL